MWLRCRAILAALSRFQRKAGIENCDAVRRDRFRESDILRHIFERVVAGCMVNGLVKGEGFAVDAIVMEANASRYHGKAPDELDWTDAQRQKRAVAEYLAALEAEAGPQEERNAAMAMAQKVDESLALTASRRLPFLSNPFATKIRNTQGVEK